MTLDEAIKHAEEVAVENLEKTKSRNAGDPIAINCFECAEEHRQLAEWLKELKQLRDQTKWIPVSEDMPKVTDYYLIQHTRKYCNDEMAVAFYSVEEAHVDPNYTWEFVTHSDVQEVIAWMPLPKKYEPQ